jgi:hypothetical protein
MAKKADFTEDEWKALEKGVTGAGLYVSASDPGFMDTFGEANALAKELGAEHASSDNELVRELAGTHGTGFGLTASKANLENETLAALSSSIATLTAKSPSDVDPYRQLVLAVATKVAGAKHGVSDAETASLEKIKEAVGASAAPAAPAAPADAAAPAAPSEPPASST